MKILTYLLVAAALATAAPAHADPAAPSTLVEEFDDIALPGGWQQLNLSAPPGQGWFQGNAGIFAAQAGAPDAYLAANFLSAGSDDGSIDLWLLTPVVNGGAELSFYLRAADAGFSNTVQVLFGAGASADPGNFTLLIDTLAPGSDWTRYQYHAGPLGEGRFAFRYTGPAASASYIGLDTLQVGPIPEPASWAMLGAGLALIGLRRRHAALLLALAALAAAPASFAQQEAAAPTAPGVIVVRDAQTGKLRAPTAAEYKALAKVAQPGVRAMTVPPATIKRADGALQRRLGEAGLTYSVISRDKDGKLRIECVQGADAAQQATQQHREDGYEDR